MAIVVFDPASFRVAYPQFADTLTWPDERLGEAFSQAELILDNSAASIVPYDPDKGITERATLFNLLVCHICTLWERGDVVGTVSSASEGSVNAGFTVPQIKNAEWFLQTPCGFSYWQATLKYRLGGRTYRAHISHSGF